MQFQRFLLLAAGIGATALTSCQSHTYRIATIDGRQWICQGRPELQDKTGYYRFTTASGRSAVVRAEDVSVIEGLN